jgi:hypothetical protein
LDIEFVEQLGSTIVSGILTREVYRLHDPAEKADFAHLNAEYGELLCRSVFVSALRCASAPVSLFERNSRHSPQGTLKERQEAPTWRG